MHKIYAQDYKMEEKMREYLLADEVRRETAKRIADWLGEGCFSAGLDTSVLFIAELIRRSYGVEVD